MKDSNKKDLFDELFNAFYAWKRFQRQIHNLWNANQTVTVVVTQKSQIIDYNL